jgi:hypothetical protein
MLLHGNAFILAWPTKHPYFALALAEG